MEKLLIAAMLACHPGDRLVDWSGKFPQGLHVADFVVTVNPIYSRFLIYKPGYPESIQRCCNNKPTSVIRMAVGDGRFCIGQSQLQMKWTARVLLRPDIEM
jgi:hypothetical protein